MPSFPPCLGRGELLSLGRNSQGSEATGILEFSVLSGNGGLSIVLWFSVDVITFRMSPGTDQGSFPYLHQKHSPDFVVDLNCENLTETNAVDLGAHL